MNNRNVMRDRFIYATRMIEVLEKIPCLMKNREHVRIHEIPAIIHKLNFASPEVLTEFDKDMISVIKIAEDYKSLKNKRREARKQSEVAEEIYEVWMSDCLLDIGDIFMKWKHRYISITDLDFY